MFVTNFLPHVGGLEYYVHDLASALSNDWKDEAHIICFDNSEEPSKSHGLYIVHRIRRVALLAGVFAIPHPLSALRILRIVKQSIENDSVIWSHTRFFISSLMAVIIAKLWRLPSLHIEHGSSFVVHSS
jgi:glycosyltransferase involved in cell wall biosynthesis